MSAALLSGCGGEATHVDRALLFDFPSDPEEVKGAAARILAQAEKDGGQCLTAARALSEAAKDFYWSDYLADEAAVDSVDLDSDVSLADSDDAQQDRSKAQQAMLAATTKTTEQCGESN